MNTRNPCSRSRSISSSIGAYDSSGNGTPKRGCSASPSQSAAARVNSSAVMPASCSAARRHRLEADLLRGRQVAGEQRLHHRLGGQLRVRRGLLAQPPRMNNACT